MTTAILSALGPEQQGLVDLLERPERTSVAGRNVFTGRLWGHPVVMTLARIGKVAAATTATLLAERFGASRMVFTGVAGGLAAGVQVGDVVVARQTLQHDMDASPLFAPYEIPLYGQSHFSSDAALSAGLLASATALIAADSFEPAIRERYALDGARVHHGLVVSGDRFVSTSAESQTLRQRLPAALAVDMESAAAAQVCHDYGLPFAAVRTISDRADDVAHVDFNAFLAEVASPYALAIVGRWLRDTAPPGLDARGRA